MTQDYVIQDWKVPLYIPDLAQTLSHFKAVTAYLDRCEDGHLISTIPYNLVEDTRQSWFPWGQIPYAKAICSGVTCYKIGRSRESVLRDQTSISVSSDEFVGGLFHIFEGDWIHR
ncbi:hypothetical protein BON22_4355 [Cyberlindnera fabianii]|uniref:Uncharacterized protein n=1 Tax=Cyberlindnera fabianii TaxID=36022 RepID=A0A1V2L1L8_CYBFA|nr:hypothetical protein BON22_4355 [Cyberlindnera fabianii]